MKISIVEESHRSAAKRMGKHTFEKLKRIEIQRRNVMKKSLVRNPLMTLYLYEGTGVKFVVQDPIFIITLALYAIVRTASYVWFEPSEEDIDAFSTFQMAVFGGLLNMFQLLYLSHCYARFMAQFGAAGMVYGRIMDISMIARTALDKWTATRLLRYLNAAHLCMYTHWDESYVPNG